MADPSDSDPTSAREVGTRALLVVDDDPGNRRALRRAFSADYSVYEASDGEEALAIARRVRPHVVISDQRMPKMNGVDLLATLKDALPHSVRVLVTGYHDYSSVVEAVNAARVHHYFEKPFHTTDLKTVVSALVRAEELQREREQLTTQLEEANQALARRREELETLVEARMRELRAANVQLERVNERLRELTVRDELTRLFNRRSLLEQLELELSRSRRYQRPFSILFLDVDNFKQINDLHGHAIGDTVLCQVAERLGSVEHGGRRSDFVARYGGEEFCVLLPETPLAGARVKAERVRLAVESLRLDATKTPDLRITVSIGVAAYPEDGETVDALLRSADEAQYRAKRCGKNRVVAFREQSL